MLQPEQQGREGEHPQVMRGALLVAGSHASMLLHATNQPLDPISLAIGDVIEVRVTLVVRTLVPAAWNDRSNATAGQSVPHRGVAVALVADEPRGKASGTAWPSSPDLPLGEQRIDIERFVTLAS